LTSDRVIIEQASAELRRALGNRYDEEALEREDYPRAVTLPWDARQADFESSLTPELVASVIDHTRIKADTTEAQIAKLCEEAREYGFASVAINPNYVSLAKRLLAGTKVAVDAAIGFPLGTTTREVKAFEARQCVERGSEEVDMVLSIGALKEGDFNYVLDEIRAVVDAVEGKAIVKVILETCLLTEEEKVQACLMSKMAGADFVKTSTGMADAGATVEDIRLMRRVVGNAMGVKAAGGIRDYETYLAMIKAGATRVGCSAGVSIIDSLSHTA
jgi:deoxyribose-phosphate aldolase